MCATELDACASDKSRAGGARIHRAAGQVDAQRRPGEPYLAWGGRVRPDLQSRPAGGSSRVLSDRSATVPVGSRAPECPTGSEADRNSPFGALWVERSPCSCGPLAVTVT